MKNHKGILGKALLPMALVGTMLLSSGCGSQEGSSDADTLHVTCWLPRGEDTSFYDTYNDNPIVKYLRENYTFDGKKVEVEYFVAPPGSESDDFANLLGTGDYCDIMDMSKATSSAMELYQEDIIWDLTELIPANMPNLMAYLEANPDVEQDMYNIVDGEKKLLALYGVSDKAPLIFEGYCYRRDWIVKYGANPQTGAAFTGGYEDPADTLSWEDDVVFPSGGDEPIYISDWEWMFEIFQRALEDQGIEDGYCFAPFFWGYQKTGDFYTGFGGGCPDWYIDPNTDKVVNGTVNDNMRAYLQCLNTWYNKGWLDKAFGEHTGDMFFAVDSAKVFQGKVGAWQGRISTVGAQIDAGDEFTKGAMVFGARQPINDVYGKAEQQGKEPDTFYQFEKLGIATVLTKKLTEEEVATYLKYADFLYSEEGALLSGSGFNEEQAAKAQDAFYERTGHSAGLYEMEDRNGVQTVVYRDNVDSSSNEFTALILNRVSHRLGLVSRIDTGYDRYLTQAVEAWGTYGERNTSIPVSVNNAVSAEDRAEISKIMANLEPFLQKSVAAMIKGEGYDVWDDGEWDSYVKTVQKYQAEKVTEIYNAAYETVK